MEPDRRAKLRAPPWYAGDVRHPAVMTRGKVNVSFPLWDALLGTTLPEGGAEHERA